MPRAPGRGRIVRLTSSGSPAPWVILAVSIAAQLAVTAAGADPFAMIDLKVYVDGAGHVADGRLYDFFSEPTHLPFTYPVFSAVAFTTIAWLPWTVVRMLWQVGSIAALAAIVHLSLRLTRGSGRAADGAHPDRLGLVVLITALAIWLEPVRTNLNYGQINLFLAALLLAGAVSSRQWFAGASVGLAAGIKLVPAITGLYYLMVRRWVAATWSVAVFAATLIVSVLVLPAQTWRYFSDLIFDPGRTGPVWSAINQSWRGALARLAGEDVPMAWAAVSVVTAVVGVWAARRALLTSDRAAGFLAIQVIGLLVSPISWSHHWIWVVPILIWCLVDGSTATRWLAGGWLVATCSYLVPILIVLQGGSEGPASRPWWQSVLGLAYPVLGMATLAVIGWFVPANRAVATR